MSPEEETEIINLADLDEDVDLDAFLDEMGNSTGSGSILADVDVKPTQDNDVVREAESRPVAEKTPQQGRKNKGQDPLRKKDKKTKIIEKKGKKDLKAKTRLFSALNSPERLPKPYRLANVVAEKLTSELAVLKTEMNNLASRRTGSGANPDKLIALERRIQRKEEQKIDIQMEGARRDLDNRRKAEKKKAEKPQVVAMEVIEEEEESTAPEESPPGDNPPKDIIPTTPDNSATGATKKSGVSPGQGRVTDRSTLAPAPPRPARRENIALTSPSALPPPTSSTGAIPKRPRTISLEDPTVTSDIDQDSSSDTSSISSDLSESEDELILQDPEVVRELTEGQSDGRKKKRNRKPRTTTLGAVRCTRERFEKMTLLEQSHQLIRVKQDSPAYYKAKRENRMLVFSDYNDVKRLGKVLRKIREEEKAEALKIKAEKLLQKTVGSKPTRKEVYKAYVKVYKRYLKAKKKALEKERKNKKFFTPSYSQDSHGVRPGAYQAGLAAGERARAARERSNPPESTVTSGAYQAGLEAGIQARAARAEDGSGSCPQQYGGGEPGAQRSITDRSNSVPPDAAPPPNFNDQSKSSLTKQERLALIKRALQAKRQAKDEIPEETSNAAPEVQGAGHISYYNTPPEPVPPPAGQGYFTEHYRGPPSQPPFSNDQSTGGVDGSGQDWEGHPDQGSNRSGYEEQVETGGATQRGCDPQQNWEGPAETDGAAHQRRDHQGGWDLNTAPQGGDPRGSWEGPERVTDRTHPDLRQHVVTGQSQWSWIPVSGHELFSDHQILAQERNIPRPVARLVGIEDENLQGYLNDDGSVMLSQGMTRFRLRRQYYQDHMTRSDRIFWEEFSSGGGTHGTLHRVFLTPRLAAEEGRDPLDRGRPVLHEMVVNHNQRRERNDRGGRGGNWSRDERGSRDDRGPRDGRDRRGDDHHGRGRYGDRR